MKKHVVRALGLAIALVLCFWGQAGADPAYGNCYVWCSGNNEVYQVHTAYGCCGPVSSWDFTCPLGEQAWGIGYYDGPYGPYFCS